MYYCSVSSGGVSVNFSSDVDLFPHFASESYTRFVPDYGCQTEESDTCFRIKYHDNLNERVEFARTLVSARFPWSAMRSGETLLYLSYPFLEYQRQMSGSLTCHAASCAYGANGVLLLGKEGSGKTTTAIQLCRQHGYRLMSNDLCLLKRTTTGIQLVGGTKFFFLRKASVERSLSHLLPFFQGDGDAWLEKVIIEPSTLGIDVQEHPVPMTGVYLLHVDEDQQSLYSKRMDDLVTKLYLNENFSRYIRSTCTTVLGRNSYDFLGYIPSLDEEWLYNMRRDLINHLLQDLGVWYVSGKSESIAHFIASKTQM